MLSFHDPVPSNPADMLFAEASDVPIEFMVHYNAVEESDCAWYSRYPFDVTLDSTPPPCMPSQLSICQYRNNEKNPQGGGTGACVRDNDANAYVTIARVPMPVHLVVELFDKQKRLWDGAMWNGAMLGLQPEEVPPTAFASNTVDGNDWDRHYEDMGIANPWRSQTEWPAGLEHGNNVCKRKGHKEVRLGSQEWGEVVSYPEAEIYTTCITWPDRNAILTDSDAVDASRCEICDVGEAGCVGRPHLIDSEGKDCDSSYGIRASCLSNIHSVSERTCWMVSQNTCVNQQYLLLNGVIEESFRSAAGRSHVHLRLPKDETRVQWEVYSDTSCNTHWHRSRFSNDITVIDSRTHSAKLVLTQTAVDSGWSCSCSETYSYLTESNTGMRKCMACTASGVYPGSDPVLANNCFDHTVCRQCDNDKHYQLSTSTCVPCPPATPMRENFNPTLGPGSSSKWEKCFACGPFQWYNLAQRCHAITQITLLRAIAKSSTTEHVSLKDYYRLNKDASDLTENGYDEVGVNYYRTIGTDEKQNQYYTRTPCSSVCHSDSFTFAQWCGSHAVRISDGLTIATHRDAYVIRIADQSEEHPAVLWSTLSTGTVDADPAKYAIQRAGKCLPCTSCPFTADTWGSYNHNCGHDWVSPGACEFCSDPTGSELCNDRQYVFHKHDEGCFGQQARSDYECGDCDYAAVHMTNAVPSAVYLLVGCGLESSITLWDLESKLPAARDCTYDDGTATTNLCYYPWEDTTPTIPSLKLTRLHPDYAKIFYKDENAYQMQIPYCPPGYYFDSTSTRCDVFDSTDSVKRKPYEESCCVYCETLPPGKRRDLNVWKECLGHSLEDTQKKGHVLDCGAQTYTTEGDINTCHSCTRCHGESV